MRYIISFDCSEPFTVDGVDFVRCVVVGQSFMLHQIRKLIGMMLGVVRGAWTEAGRCKMKKKLSFDP